MAFRARIGRRMKRIPHILALGILLAALFSCSDSRGPGPSEPRPRIVDGVLDLSAWDFSTQGSLRLEGEWDFYPGELLTGELGAAAPAAKTHRRVPDLWKGGEALGAKGQGCGSYHLIIRLPPNRPELALRYWTVSTAFELDANGKTVASAGKPAGMAREAVPNYRPGVAALSASGETLDLVVRVSNYEYRSGGMWRSFILGSLDELEAQKRKTDILIFVEAAAILVMALDSLILFLFRRKEKAYLFFALFGLSLVFRVLVTGEYLIMSLLPNLPFDLLIRFEYASVALPIPLCALFCFALFPEESSKLLVTLVCLPFILRLAFGVTIVPLPLLTRSIYVFYPMAVVAILAMFFWGLIPAVLKKRQGAMPIFLGSLLLLLAFVNDSLYSSFIINTGNFLGVGLLAFIIIQSGVLAKRFTLAFDRSEALQEELSIANEKLGEENDLLRLTQSRLEAALAEKDILLREVHHRVKNSLQIVSSTLALQSHRAKDPAALEIYETIRRRIRAISLVHEKLYGLDSAECMDLGEYARDLAGQLSGSYFSEGGESRLVVNSDRIMAPMDLCVDFGLLMTELVANAYKHSQVVQRGGTVKVLLKYEDRDILLRIEDDGPGFPADFSPESAKSLGFTIVTSLIKKRNGSLRIGAGPGAVIELRFPMESAESL